MPSSSAGRSTDAEVSSVGRTTSLLSRIKSPFGAKPRNIGEYYIQPDDPHRQYGPGDVIKGSIILKVLKPLRVTHITVCLHGFVQVYKSANNPGENYRAYTGSSTPGRTSRTGYFGNGFASLFQDEIALCGEGRLGEGTYQFGYELVFPKDRLPSDIEFERGTIAYMITSTLTKPTAIAPTSFCDRRVNFGENIDIASLHPPKPRFVTLEPLSKRGRSKHIKRTAAGSDNSQRKSASIAGSDGAAVQRTSTGLESQAEGDSPMSPAPSVTSFDSGIESCGTGSAMDSTAQSALSNGTNKAAHHDSSTPQRPISATINVSRSGYLRGDNIQVRIGIQHRKVVRSLHGIIVTFYRQARVDMHPGLPVISRDGKETKSEDYYPKSKTGLGGLSLSAAGSSHVFRKDMSQSFASLIINPDTMSADIKAAVRVPDDAFPTISCVPGDMISFKYYVEVIVDLQGKLSGLDRLFPSSGNRYGPGAGTNIVDGTGGSMMSAWGGHLIDTQDIRREKSVVTCLFEVVIGTRDSERLPNHRMQQVIPLNEHGDSSDVTDDAQARAATAAPVDREAGVPNEGPEPYDYDTATRYDERYDYDGYNNGYHNGHHNGYHNGYDNGWHHPHHQYPVTAPTNLNAIPPPDLSETHLTEKERLQRAEARLLPSQPPDADDGEPSASAPRDVAPSAPRLELSESNRTVQAPAHPPEFERGHPPSGPPGVEPAGPSSAAPEYTGPGSSSGVPTDDKQELHRRRLEMERSAPDETPEEDGPASAPGPSTTEDQNELPPSAPVLPDDGDDHEVGGYVSQLPKYER